MKSFIFSVLILTLAMSFAYAQNGAESTQPAPVGPKIIREWK